MVYSHGGLRAKGSGHQKVSDREITLHASITTQENGAIGSQRNDY
jgi:hypothetical protein